MSDVAYKVVIDCSATGAPDQAVVAQIEADALALLRAGNAEAAATVMDAARAAHTLSLRPTETIVPFTEDDVAQRASDEQAAAMVVQQEQDRAWIALRMKRDRWLAQTDAFFITPLPSDFPKDKADAITANLDAWKAFRQTLRDFPAKVTDPASVEWPPQPAEPAVYLT